MVDDERSHQSLLLRLKTSVQSAVRFGLRYSSDVLFPATCVGCRIKVSEPGTLCPHCWSQLRFIEKPYCPDSLAALKRYLGDVANVP